MKPAFPHLYRQDDSGQAMCYAWFAALHTRIDLALCGPYDEVFLVDVLSQIAERLWQVERMGNYFDPQAELAQLNQQAATVEVAVSNELFQIIRRCKQYHALTQGCFDVAIQSQPHDGDCMEAILTDNERHTIRFAHQGIRIDLSGFLKGYALDCIRALLQAAHITSALINLGNSSILALGCHPSNEQGWEVSFQHDPSSRITLHNQCLTTSGNDHDQRRHIIVPSTGRYVEGKRHVAVVTNTGEVGEMLSTALVVATAEQQAAIKANAGPDQLHWARTWLS